MALLIGLVLLVTVSYLAYRDGRRALTGRGAGNPVLRRLERELDAERLNPDRLDLDRLRADMHAAAGVGSLPDDAAPETIAESRETALTRQLLAGAVEASAYQQRMSELAHASTKQGRAS